MLYYRKQLCDNVYANKMDFYNAVNTNTSVVNKLNKKCIDNSDYSN